MDTRIEKRHICLTGFMGSGKSTIGKMLAADLGFPFIDTDDRIESGEGMTVKEIFARKGEEYFRRKETVQIIRALESSARMVISLGGGALLHRPNRDQVREKALLIYIYSRPEQIYDRIKHSTKRPLFRAEHEDLDAGQSLLRIKELMAKRAAGYSQAEIVFDRDPWDAETAARKILEMIREDYPEFMHSGANQR